ncbi:hypothetical protein FRC12_015886 [Ceratobasidium sp. 428]|nr:hypothetical protein FRC12_015886 [Ceratobasidium sp. 428]
MGPGDDLALGSRPLHRGSGCHECRRRKLKCSGTKPTCDRCVRSGTQCVYDPVEKSKVALLRDEVLMLRQKVKTLEAQVMSPPPLSTSSPANTASRPGSHEPTPRLVPTPPGAPGSHVLSTTPPRVPARLVPTPPAMWRAPLSKEDQLELMDRFIAVQHIANEYVSFSREGTGQLQELQASKTSAYLLASHFSPVPSPSIPTSLSLPPTQTLLDWSRLSIDESIRLAGQTQPTHSAPLVLDAIHALSLLACWMMVNARLLECQQALFSAAKLAILSGLHKLRSLTLPLDSKTPPLTEDAPPSMVARPTSSTDVKYRVGIFWQLLCLDYTAAIIMGDVSVSLPWEDCPSEVQVETVWPMFEVNCSPGKAGPGSIASLFRSERTRAPSPKPVGPIDAGALRAQAIVLLERAVRVSALWRRNRSRSPSPASPRSPTTATTTTTSARSNSPSDEAIRKAIQETDWAISSVLEQIPLGAGKTACLLPHTLLLCARVRLHETRAEEGDRVSQMIWVQSAVAIVRLLDGVEGADVKWPDLLLAYSWLASHMVLLHEHTYVPYRPDSEHAIKIRADLDKLKKLLDGLSARMPIVATMYKTAVDQFHAQRKLSNDVKMEEDELAGDHD